MNYSKGFWSVAENGGTGDLVGIKTDKSDWFIAQELSLHDALAICYWHNMQEMKDFLNIPDSDIKGSVICNFSSCEMNYFGFCKGQHVSCHKRDF
jgi:hypothetical protein